MKIQQGLAEVADMRVADRQNYHAATMLLDKISVPRAGFETARDNGWGT